MLEPVVGPGLEGVRIHTGEAAANAAEALSAEAFTVGRDVFFARGRFDPSSTRGRALLAHELTHVRQQTGPGGARVLGYGGATGPAEAEAQASEETVLRGGRLNEGDLTVGRYVRNYLSADGQPLSPANRMRLDAISLAALRVCRQLLGDELGRIGAERIGRLSVDLSLDLSSVSDEQAAQVWGRSLADTIRAELEGPAEAGDLDLTALLVQRSPGQPATEEKGAVSSMLEVFEEARRRGARRAARMRRLLKLLPKQYRVAEAIQWLETARELATKEEPELDLALVIVSSVNEFLYRHVHGNYERHAGGLPDDSMQVCLGAVEAVQRLRTLLALLGDSDRPMRRAEWQASIAQVTKARAYLEALGKPGVTIQKDLGVSVELRGGTTNPVTTKLAGRLMVSEAHVLAWLREHKAEIVAAEARRRIDRRAIAGAIAWEALLNVRSVLWRTAGPGKVHSQAGYVFEGEPVAKQVEEAGYLPKRSHGEREEALATPAGAIEYIAAIMAAGADIAESEGYDIRDNPAVLCFFYQSKDLGSWSALMRRNREQGKPESAFVPGAGPPEKEMGQWVARNVEYLEEAVGRPELPSQGAPAQRGAVQRQPKPGGPPEGGAKEQQALQVQQAAARPASGDKRITRLVEELGQKGLTAAGLARLARALGQRNVGVTQEQGEWIVAQVVTKAVAQLTSKGAGALTVDDVRALAEVQKVITALRARGVQLTAEQAASGAGIATAILGDLNAREVKALGLQDVQKLTTVLESGLLSDEQVKGVGIVDRVTAETDRFLAGLAPVVRDSIERVIGSLPRARPHPIKVLEWLAWMKTYVDDPTSHFLAIQVVDVPYAGQVFLHESAKGSLEAVAAELGKENMPGTNVGFGLREQGIPYKKWGPGMMCHALGYAVDYRAARNPHVTDPRLVRLFELVTGEEPALQLGPGYRDVIAKMGTGEIKPEDERAVQLFARLDAEFERFARASTRFKAIGEQEYPAKQEGAQPTTITRRERLAELRREYLAILAEEEALAKRSRKAGPDEAGPLAEQRSALEKRRQTIRGELPDLFGDWLKLIDARIAEIEANKAVATVPGQDELKKERREVTASRRAALKRQREVERAIRALDRKATSLGRQLKRAQARQGSGAAEKVRQLEEDVRACGASRTEKGKALDSAKGEVTGYDRRLAELKSLEQLVPQSRDLRTLRSLRTALTEDLRFVFTGGKGKEESSKPQVVNPAMTQLLDPEFGYFTPDPEVPAGKKSIPSRHGFSAALMKAMMRHGWELGAAWKPGSVDPMHFTYMPGLATIKRG